MAEQFQDQGGVSTSNPSPLTRFIGSIVVPRLVSSKRRDKLRAKAEKKRQAEKRPHQVHYFHQVEDAYGQLAVQLLQPLLDTYDIELIPHLATGPTGKNAPEPDMLLDYARSDCAWIASAYGLEFPANAAAPDEQAIKLASRILAAATDAEFPQIAVTVGKALWESGQEELIALEDRLGALSMEEAREQMEAGSVLREEMGHYSGAMFFYEGEWYWGVDRLYHLENRLIELGARRSAGSNLLAPRPTIAKGRYKDKNTLTLEYFPSLRSPYTSVIHDRTVTMAEDMRINFVVKPVMPMVMRGVPATPSKMRYILSDTAREAETLGMQWGKMYDPIGEPVRRGFSMYPYAVEQGRGNAYISAFLRAAFVLGVNTNNNRGLKWVCNEAGLDWEEAREHLGEAGWEEQLEENRLNMYELGLWGVPSYRLLDAQGKELLAVWGQDRLWLVSRTIQDLLLEQQGPV